jgi:predicted acylesterase/phospholipase RssA
MTEYYNTLVLSGGSIKAISQLGAIQYCYDNKLIDGVKTFIGVSAGGIIAYLLAIGYTPVEIMVYLCTHDVFKDSQYLDIVSMMNGSGALNFTKIQEHLEQMTIEKIGRVVTFQDIKEIFGKNLIITTYNWTLQTLEYQSCKTTPDMPCLIALRQSSALPLVFPPFKYMGNYYIDGGIYDNFPIDYNLDVENENNVKSHRLGIMIDFYNDNFHKNPNENNMLEYIYQIIIIQMCQNDIRKLESAKHMDVIKIQTDVSLFNFQVNNKEKMDLFSIGYQQAKEFFNPLSH